MDAEAFDYWTTFVDQCETAVGMARLLADESTDEDEKTRWYAHAKTFGETAEKTRAILATIETPNA